MILKLEFEKAFDTIKHEAILQILQARGFDLRWISWIKEFLASETSSILLIGILGVDI